MKKLILSVLIAFALMAHSLFSAEGILVSETTPAPSP